MAKARVIVKSLAASTPEGYFIKVGYELPLGLYDDRMWLTVEQALELYKQLLNKLEMKGALY